MKLRSKPPKFQEDAARAVCDVFAGETFASHFYIVDPGKGQGELFGTGFAKKPLTNSLTPEVMLSRTNKLQRDQQLEPSRKLVGPGIRLTIGMETGAGNDVAIRHQLLMSAKTLSP